MKRNALVRVGRSSRCCWWLARQTSIQTMKFPILSSSSYSSSPPPRFLGTQFRNKSISHFSSSSSSSLAYRFINTNSLSTHSQQGDDEHSSEDQTSEEETSEGWEEEDEGEPKIGDGGDGGGVILGDTFWGKRALSIANEVLVEFGDDMKLFSFKTSPRGYIYVRLDKLSDSYGCPSMEEMEKYSCLYKKKLEEVGESGEIPDDLALEVSSPGAERLLKVPDDLDRFKDFPMRVSYIENDVNPASQQKDGVFLLESIEMESGHCVWKLADVKDNRDLSGKGRPLSRKQKDWRLRLPFGLLKNVLLYLEY